MSEVGAIMAGRTVFSRREALIMSGAAAYAATAGAAQAADAAGERFGRQPGLNARQRLLLKGGTIISMDPRVGDLTTGDVLIEGTKISALAPNLSAGTRR